MAVHKSYVTPARLYNKSILRQHVLFIVSLEMLATDDICYIYPLDYIPFPNNTLTSGRSPQWVWGHISVIAEGKL